MGKRIVTSVKIDEDIWKKAKIEAINQDMQLSEVLENAVDEWIKKQKGR
jgi:regulation of enolase protein 1 (concanavalin A-like superfamily)